jgi:hypothetical protein
VRVELHVTESAAIMPVSVQATTPRMGNSRMPARNGKSTN